MTLRDFETKLLLGVQAKTRSSFLSRSAVLLGVFGEHAQGWLVIGLAGLIVNWQNPQPWVTALVTIAFSQLSSMVLKRIIRRTRPDHPSLEKSGKLYSKLSFPSSHSMSSATAIVVLFPLVPLIFGIVIIMLGIAVLASRLVVAAHFPSDVVVGAVLGLIVGVTANLLF